MSLNIIFQGWHCKLCPMLASDSPPNLDKVQSIPVTGRFGEAGDWKLGISWGKSIWHCRGYAEKGLLGVIYNCDTDSSLLGEWTSRRCEARPRSLFLTRELRFRSERKWEARYRFFVDERCNKAHFSVAVAGRFSPGGRSPVVPGGWQLHLYILNVYDCHL